MEPKTATGRPYPLGSTVTEEGINFAIFSRHATHVYLELFESIDDPRPRSSLALDPRRNRTGDVWHVFVHGLGHGQLYAYRADGPYTPQEEGHRFNVNKLLSDPYARAIVGDYNLDSDAVYGYDRASPLEDLSFSSTDSAPFTTRSMALAHTAFDWQDDPPPPHPPGALDHLRGPRQGADDASLLGHRRPGHLPRGDREDPTPPRARGDLPGAAADP